MVVGLFVGSWLVGGRWVVDGRWPLAGDIGENRTQWTEGAVARERDPPGGKAAVAVNCDPPGEAS